MLPILAFVAIIVAVFITGTVLSYPLYLFISSVSDAGLHKSVHYSILLTGLCACIIYLHKTQALAALFGSANTRKQNLKLISAGFAAGLVILLIIESSLIGLGLRQPDPDLGEGLVKFIVAVIKAVVTGFIVSFMEESLYRGGIFTGLARYTNFITALLITSIFYGAVHFIDFPEPVSGSVISWSTSFGILSQGFMQFSDPLILDSVFSLALLGLLFGMMRWRTGNLMLCTGAHAGIVTANKIFSYSTDYKSGSPYEFLVNSYDHQTGLLASTCLIIACLIYYYRWMKNKKQSA